MKEKIVLFTGAGISAESGLRTFRDMGGLWHEYSLEEVATPEGFAANPELVLRFYNERRQGVLDAKPNAAHLAIGKLEEKYDVVVITQNIDDLHERGGSTNVIHVHGEILKARSSADESLIYPMTKASIEIGELCEHGSQLRPHVVWFGEAVLYLDEAAKHIKEASKILAVGTSLSVYPAANLVHYAPYRAKKYFVSPEHQEIPHGYRFMHGPATQMIPLVIDSWMQDCEPT
jgi:NAD-dependent deacetylase